MILQMAQKGKIHVQMVQALLMVLRCGEINGLKYSDIDFVNHRMRLQRQLGEELHAEEDTIAPNMKILNEPEQKTNCIHYIPGSMIYDYSDVYEMDDIAEWHMGKGAAQNNCPFSCYRNLQGLL